MEKICILLLIFVVLIYAVSVYQIKSSVRNRKKWLDGLRKGTWVVHRSKDNVRFEGWIDDARIKLTTFEGKTFTDYSFTITPL